MVKTGNTPITQLVEQHIIRQDDPRWQAIDATSFAAKNIYNAAPYKLHQSYIPELDFAHLNTLNLQTKQAGRQ